MESFAVTDITAVTNAVLFRSESKGSGFSRQLRDYEIRTKTRQRGQMTQSFDQ